MLTEKEKNIIDKIINFTFDNGDLISLEKEAGVDAKIINLVDPEKIIKNDVLSKNIHILIYNLVVSYVKEDYKEEKMNNILNNIFNFQDINKVKELMLIKDDLKNNQSIHKNLKEVFKDEGFFKRAKSLYTTITALKKTEGLEYYYDSQFKRGKKDYPILEEAYINFRNKYEEIINLSHEKMEIEETNNLDLER